MTDFLLDDDLDILIEDGDLAIGEVTKQNQELLLLTAKGSWREFPTRGMNLRDWLLDDAAGDLNGAIKREFTADGMTVKSVNTQSGQINVEAYYG